MIIIPKRKIWTKQPPQGAKINLASSQARGLICYLPFNGPVVSDLSTSRLNLTALGTLDKTPYGYGRLFDGSTSVQVTPVAEAKNAIARTVCAFVKFNSFSNSYNALFGCDGENGGYFDLHIRDTGKLACYCYTTTNVSYDGSGAYTLLTGVWYHLAMTYSASGGLVGYVNSLVDGTAAAYNDLTSLAGTSVLNVGNNAPNFPTRLINGTVYDARFYNRALTQQEIRNIYKNPWKIFNSRSRHVFVGESGGGADVTTSGSISSLSLTAVTGSSTGSATTSGSIGSISLSAAIGSATSSVSATAAIEAVSLSAATGSATGSATATGTVTTVSLTAATGTASTAGDATTDGAIAALSLSSATGSATGTAVASGLITAISLTAATGAAITSVSATGSIATVSLTAATGAASTGGDVAASANIPTLSLSATTGVATGTATASAALAPISLSAATGTAAAGADVSASGYIAVIGLTAPVGTAAAAIEAQAAIAAVFMSAPAGSATGNAVASGTLSAVSLRASTGSATDGATETAMLDLRYVARAIRRDYTAIYGQGSRNE